jgi:hypothetical protein
MPLAGQGMLFFQNDVLPEHEREYNDYYLRQHIVERVCVPNFLGGRRYRSVDGSSHRYLNLYETVTVDAMFSEAYRAVLDRPSEWTRRMMPVFTNMVRGTCRVGGSAGVGFGGAAWAARFSAADERRESLRSWLAATIDEVSAHEQICSAHWLEAVQGVAGNTKESKFRTGPDAKVDLVLIIEGDQPESFKMAEDIVKDAARQGAQDIQSSPRYRLLFAVPPGAPSALPQAAPGKPYHVDAP